jgi:asparagine synthase (glutamine-hydrolysing)
MCGFIGIFGNKAKTKKIHHPLQLISHRGPDGSVIYEKSGFVIGSTRLAIVPPHSFDGVSCLEENDLLTLNGEIFYDTEILQGKTDTIVLHERIRQNGLLTELSTIRGLFAICRCDTNGLHLARDPFGIKPLYYSELPGGSVAFASEIKALLGMKEIDKALDNDVLMSYRVLGYNIFSGKTPFKKIKSVEPGTCITFTWDGEKKIISYSNSYRRLSISSEINNPLEVSFHVEKLLSLSLKRNFNHDPNPKAIFLSGGLDSACLLVQALKLNTIEPYSLWDGEHIDDICDAKNLCKQLGVNLNLITISTDELDKAIVHYAWHYEFPIGGAGFDLFGGIAFHILAKHIADRRHRVAFCGEGADELFLGYHQYHMEPELLKSKLLTILSKSKYHPLRLKLQELGIFAEGEQLAYAMRNLAFEYGLSEYHLPSVDRSGMAFGLEIRPPYLDPDMSKLTSSLPPQVFIDRKENWTKLPLRILLKRHITDTNIRSAVRRKRAMAYSVQSQACEIEKKIYNIVPNISFSELIWRLFFYMHLSNNFPEAPDIRFSELVPELTKLACPLCESF